MACGCNDQARWMRASVAAAMCDHCPGSRKDEVGWAVACTISGRRIAEHAYGGLSCPRGRHPDQHGLVRWLGVEWYGLPYPLRVWRWATRFNELELDSFMARIPGCGCLRRAKDAWQRFMQQSFH